jgi:predicted ArsR family transcriptional regulator
MQAVADALTAHGFAAHAAGPPEVNAVERGHCPFGNAAIENPVLCAADRGLVEGLLSVLCGDSVPVQLTSRAMGDETCVTVAG